MSLTVDELCRYVGEETEAGLVQTIRTRALVLIGTIPDLHHLFYVQEQIAHFNRYRGEPPHVEPSLMQTVVLNDALQYWGLSQGKDTVLVVDEGLYALAPCDLAIFPSYWQELLEEELSVRLPLEEEAPVPWMCSLCGRLQMQSAEERAWAFEASPFAACGDEWRFVLPAVFIPRRVLVDEDLDARLEADLWGASYREPRSVTDVEDGVSWRSSWS